MNAATDSLPISMTNVVRLAEGLTCPTLVIGYLLPGFRAMINISGGSLTSSWLSDS